MIELPADVESALVRGIGVYLRSTPPERLPARVRRVRSFRPQALGRHREELLALLDDSAMRALIGEWIRDGRRSLAKRDAELLRTAVERREGWEQQLARRAQRRTRPSRQRDPAAATDRKLEQERDKLRRARNAEQQLRSELKAERAAANRLRAELKEATNAARQASARAGGAERGRERAEAALDRERRRGASAAERNRADVEKVRTELRAARKEIAALKRRVASLEGVTEGAASATAVGGARRRAKKPSSRPRPTGRRRVLRVPKGLLEDDPGTLDEWLDEPSLALLIDGYNVTKSVGGYGDLELERQRELLLDGVARLARRKKVHATVVFDGSDVAPGTPRRSRAGVRVEYSKPEEAADDHIVALLEGLPSDPVVLVTSDRELQERGARLRATIATSPQLLALIRRPGRASLA
jgi:predicted RNA-binding protein with PIN domain